MYAETSREVAALEAISGCHRRLVLLHYAPTSDTLDGEPSGIWAILGSARVASPGRSAPTGPTPSSTAVRTTRHVTGKDFAVAEV